MWARSIWKGFLCRHLFGVSPPKDNIVPPLHIYYEKLSIKKLNEIKIVENQFLN